ncbi:hypothetical protein OL239_12335 [Arthrobacter sp. ATA002]|uniref:hypothetical protein n=1 Tax=Arthrobacter sp. ATA002 TaxID=2991715 RepID=UPI0022A6D905|nr:hypothetical protein [Arthrobacter sp. ATA002]WAP50790.1 hypothetical protein OL239_12335 [Arthrobacter sp. ATA002]
MNCASEEVPGLAFTVSGSAEAVERLAEGRTVLLSHAVGTLKSATISGAADDGFRAQAQALGASVSPATLPDLVAGFGADAPEPVHGRKEAHA